MVKRLAIVFALVAGSAAPAAAQFSQFIGFGDSTMDTGWYRSTTTGNPLTDARIAAAVAAGGRGAPVGVGLMAPEVLAAHFGLTALPANVPGGTDFATGGALNAQLTPTGNTAAVPTVTQISNYLAGGNGLANRNALYLIGSGGNDITSITNTVAASQQIAAGVQSANALVAGIVRLSQAGAHYIIVPNQPDTFGAASLQALRTTYDTTLWSGLTNAGVRFIPADYNSLLHTIIANPGSFGLTSVAPGVPGPGTTSACQAPAGVTSAWGVFCTPTTTPSAVTASLTSPNSPQTSLFVDDLHLSAAGQKILADYYYNLVVAPTQMSLLAETPLKTRAGVVVAIENQIPLSQAQRGPHGFNVWATGDLTSLKVDSFPGSPGESGTPASVTVGLDYKSLEGWLVGIAFSGGTQKPSFDTGGSFRQDDFAVSLYGAYTAGPWWIDLIGTVGALNYDINRIAPIGITLMSNSASTSGTNVSFAAEGGYDLATGWLKHGPLVGILLQSVHVNAFTETGSVASLAFGEQTRNSAVSEIGYRASFDVGVFQPFAKVAWNHELASTDRQVTAFLTTVAAPGYSLPAVDLGTDWGSGTVGTTMKLGNGVTALAAFTGEVGQNGVVAYGGQIGLNVAF